ncbi:MAG: DUF58 domain-containing protein [Nanobdellota archaeon]
MIDTDFLDQLARFNLVIRKRVTSSFTGTHKSHSFGTGTELRDMREYVHGDDIRQIDWNIFARTDKLHVKRFEEEKHLPVHIIIDYSNSMNFGRDKTKFDYGCMLGIGFAFLAMKNNDKFEFSTFSEDLYPVKARRGRKQLAGIIDHLEKLKAGGRTDFEKMMSRYRRFIKNKSMVVIISDFMFDREQIEKGLSYFRKHDLKVIQLLDKSEVNLDLEGDLKLKDSEDNSMMRTYLSKKMKERYYKQLEEHKAFIQKTVESLRGTFYPADTSQDVFNILFNTIS